MKNYLAATCLLLSSFASTQAHAGSGIQIFGESGDDNVSIKGANFTFAGFERDENSLTYAGFGIKTVRGLSPEFDGSYPQIIVGAALPWRISPYVEAGVDPIDMFVEDFDENDDGVNSYLGIGARVSLHSRLSLDFGYRYHHFSNNDDNFTFDHHSCHCNYGNRGVGVSTTSLSLNLFF